MGTWIEVALNGPWSRARQPAMPITVAEVVDEGIRCARAGAAIVHVHAYDPATGLQNDDPDTYAAIIEGIRGVEDVVVYPTLPFVQSADAFGAEALSSRYRAVEELGRRGLLEWGVVDPGTINLATFDELAGGGAGSVYANPGEHVRRGLALATEYGAVPSYAIYEPGFTRLGAALARLQTGCPPPVYRFMFSDAFTFGFPPEPFGLDAHLALLDREAPGAPWMVAGLGVEIAPLIPHAVARGGHVRVGLEDAPFGTMTGNLARVEDAVRAVEGAGGTVAKAADVRRRLARSTATGSRD